MEAILTLLLCVGVVSGSQTYCVISNIPAVKDNSSCETLEFYASSESEYFTDNTSFIFLPGTHVLSNISISNVSNVMLMASTEENVTILCNGSGGLVFQHAFNVTLANLSFISCGQPLPHSLQREGETAQAALAFGQVTDLQLESVSVSHSRGYGLLGHCVHGDFNITNSHFTSNKGSGHYLGGNAAIEYTSCSQPTNSSNSLLILSSKFMYGDYEFYQYTNYTGTLATGLMLILSQTNTTVLITNVLMEENRNSITKGYGGNLFVHFYNETNFTSNSVTITNSKFLKGTGFIGTGIGATFYTPSPMKLNNTTKCTNSLVINNTEISGNMGIVGSGLYYEFQAKYSKPTSCPHANFLMFNCTFNNNSIVIPHKNPFQFSSNGIALQIVAKYHKNLKAEKIPGHYKILIENCSFINSNLINSSIEEKNGTQLALPNVMTVLIENADKKVQFCNCQFLDNKFAALGVFNSLIALAGVIKIQNNLGTNGGGMMLCESSFVYLSNKTTVHFRNNSATQTGGGIYVEKQCSGSKPFCFYQLPDSRSCDIPSTKIIMANNSAGIAGDHIYGGNIDYCKINDCESGKIFHSLFKIPHSDTAVSSSPRKICFCNHMTSVCEIRQYNYHKKVYPGENIMVRVSILGQLNGTVPSTLAVYSKQRRAVVHTSTITKSCQNLNITITSDGSGSEDLIFHRSSDVGDTDLVYPSMNDAFRIHVQIKRCPMGFIQRSGKCDCNANLPDHQVKCTISANQIQVSPPAWIGLNNETGRGLVKGIIYHGTCPYSYCRNEETNVTSNGETFDQDVQCALNRTGLLCSRCVDGLSLSHGSSGCVDCKNQVGLPVTILGYGFVGVFLVLVLLMLNITITDGMLSGLLFYTSIVNLNRYTFLPEHNQNALTIIISLLNFSIGYTSCFYDGMDSYAKTWISFIFPIYLFTLTAVIILLARKSSKISWLLGGNITKVLATLFLLSYTKLIQSVVIVLSYTTIQYPSNNSTTVDKIVWTSDPTLEYFSGKHIPLALVAIVFGLLILAFTMVLLCVQPLQRYSHLRCFSWMAKIKPFIDAYTAPHIIKDNCRYWEGLLLFFRLVLAAIFALYDFSNGRLNQSLYPISFFCVLLLTVSWSNGGIYKKIHLNILNLTSIVNLCIMPLYLTTVKSPLAKYIYQNRKLVKAGNFRAATYSSFSIEVLLLVIILYHYFRKCVLLCNLKYRRRRYKVLEDASDEHLPPLRQFPPPR